MCNFLFISISREGSLLVGVEGELTMQARLGKRFGAVIINLAGGWYVGGSSHVLFFSGLLSRCGDI